MTIATQDLAGIADALDDAPDLERASADVRVLVYFRPSLAAPERATVEIWHAGAPLDALDVPALDALDVYRHPAAYSSVLADVLTAPRGADTYSGTEDPCESLT